MNRCALRHMLRACLFCYVFRWVTKSLRTKWNIVLMFENQNEFSFYWQSGDLSTMSLDILFPMIGVWLLVYFEVRHTRTTSSCWCLTCLRHWHRPTYVEYSYTVFGGATRRGRDTALTRVWDKDRTLFHKTEYSWIKHPFSAFLLLFLL